jgi:uncharacterized protein YkwD
MRILSWLGVVGVLVALGAGTVAVFARTSATQTPAAVQLQTAGMSYGPYEAGPRHAAAAPRPSPKPLVTAAPRPPVAHSRPVAPAPRRQTTVASTQQALINGDRARYGLGPLSWSSCLYAVAVSNARRMAAQGYISHTNGPSRDLACGLGHQAGENVGWWSGGINDSQLNTMFMNSPDHKANILGPYHYVATAWAIGANGAAYIAVEFG